MDVNGGNGPKEGFERAGFMSWIFRIVHRSGDSLAHWLFAVFHWNWGSTQTGVLLDPDAYLRTPPTEQSSDPPRKCFPWLNLLQRRD